MSRHNLWNFNNNLQRHMFLKYELKKLLLKSFKKNQNISYIRRYLALFYNSHIPKKVSISYSVYRCIRSGRVWSTSRTTNLSRFVLRNESYKGNLPGFTRASW